MDVLFDLFSHSYRPQIGTPQSYLTILSSKFLHESSLLKRSGTPHLHKDSFVEHRLQYIWTINEGHCLQYIKTY